MFPPDAICAALALFIVGMVWLRTRMQYARPPHGRLKLTAAGAAYFAALALLLVSGWWLAPLIAPPLTGFVALGPVAARGVWFLVVYYLFVPLHRALKARGAAVFAASPADRQTPL